MVLKGLGIPFARLQFFPELALAGQIFWKGSKMTQKSKVFNVSSKNHYFMIGIILIKVPGLF